jgi:hypothetical protein
MAVRLVMSTLSRAGSLFRERQDRWSSSRPRPASCHPSWIGSAPGRSAPTYCLTQATPSSDRFDEWTGSITCARGGNGTEFAAAFELGRAEGLRYLR